MLNGGFGEGPFSVCVIGHVSAAGRPESGPKRSLFYPMSEPGPTGLRHPLIIKAVRGQASHRISKNRIVVGGGALATFGAVFPHFRF